MVCGGGGGGGNRKSCVVMAVALVFSGTGGCSEVVVQSVVVVLDSARLRAIQCFELKEARPVNLMFVSKTEGATSPCNLFFSTHLFEAVDAVPVQPEL